MHIDLALSALLGLALSIAGNLATRPVQRLLDSWSGDAPARKSKSLATRIAKARLIDSNWTSAFVSFARLSIFAIVTLGLLNLLTQFYLWERERLGPVAQFGRLTFEQIFFFTMAFLLLFGLIFFTAVVALLQRLMIAMRDAHDLMKMEARYAEMMGTAKPEKDD